VLIVTLVSECKILLNCCRNNFCTLYINWTKLLEDEDALVMFPVYHKLLYLDEQNWATEFRDSVADHISFVNVKIYADPKKCFGCNRKGIQRKI